jgi:hypothetical protein
VQSALAPAVVPDEGEVVPDEGEVVPDEGEVVPEDALEPLDELTL